MTPHKQQEVGGSYTSQRSTGSFPRIRSLNRLKDRLFVFSGPRLERDTSAIGVSPIDTLVDLGSDNVCTLRQAQF
jgi:hypothetical protein